jgi:hypothetical protein
MRMHYVISLLRQDRTIARFVIYSSPNLERGGNLGVKASLTPQVQVALAAEIVRHHTLQLPVSILLALNQLMVSVRLSWLSKRIITLSH